MLMMEVCMKEKSRLSMYGRQYNVYSGLVSVFEVGLCSCLQSLCTKTNSLVASQYPTACGAHFRGMNCHNCETEENILCNTIITSDLSFLCGSSFTQAKKVLSEFASIRSDWFKRLPRICIR